MRHTLLSLFGTQGHTAPYPYNLLYKLCFKFVAVQQEVNCARLQEESLHGTLLMKSLHHICLCCCIRGEPAGYLLCS